MPFMFSPMDEAAVWLWTVCASVIVCFWCKVLSAKETNHTHRHADALLTLLSVPDSSVAVAVRFVGYKTGIT